MRDGALEGRTVPDVAPAEGALRQGLPAVVGEGCQLHSCLHLRWTQGFPHAASAVGEDADTS